MKIILVLVFIAGSVVAKGQATPAIAVADKIAQKMKDSLDLTEMQSQQIYQINLELHAAKVSKRQLYASTDSLGIHVQRVENTRDSLYRTVLSEEKYQLYREKKKNLVNNN